MAAVVAVFGLALGLGGITALPAAAKAACIDLHITTLTVSPSNPIAGADVLVTFAIQNSGSCATPPEIFVQWRPDADPAHWAPLRSLSDLSPGQTSVQYGLYDRFPNPGAYNPILVVDPGNLIAETDETNNQQSVPVSVQPATVDLTVTAVTFAPLRPVRGKPMKAIVTVRNIGSSAAKPFTVRWKPAWNQDFLTKQGTALAARASTSVTFTFTYASYWNFDSTAAVVADPNVNPETSYSNNELGFQVPVDPARPDLVIRGMHLTPAIPVLNEDVQVAFTIANIGNTASGRYSMFWQPYAQAPTTFGFGGANLEPGATRTATFTYAFRTPDVFQGEATVDSQYAILETDEGNNTILTTVPIAPYRTNLKVVAQVREATVTQDEPFHVDVTVSNTGNTATGPFAVDWNPDTTEVLGTTDLTRTQQVANLDRGQHTTLTFDYTYPTAGSYTSAAVVDAFDRVVETTDKDNRFVVPVTVANPPIDLKVTGFQLLPGTPLRSTMATAAITVKNAGTVPAGSFVVQWKLPASSGVNPRATVRGLAAGESRTLTFGGTFVDAGSAKTSAVVDVGRQVVEPGAEGNNTLAKTVTVLAPPGTGTTQKPRR